MCFRGHRVSLVVAIGVTKQPEENQPSHVKKGQPNQVDAARNKPLNSVRFKRICVLSKFDFNRERDTLGDFDLRGFGIMVYANMCVCVYFSLAEI